MGQPFNPSIKKISDIKDKLLQPALTSHFITTIVFPPNVVSRLNDNGLTGGSDIGDTLAISCSEASLPGSSLATHELNNDFTGVTQKHAYRRLYDDRADFTFYVNQNYTQIRVFEAWIRYISGEQNSFGERNNVSYRVNYPKNYKSSAIYITKFERDYGVPKSKNISMTYAFINAFPISINSMPVSYDASSLLKCTVSFSYDRYIAENINVESEPYAQDEFSVYDTKLNITKNIAPNQFNFSLPLPIDPTIAYGPNAPKINLP
jgi:hypothetical protein